jgi:uncharacterized repeat protein (TIGR03943 family)
MQAVEHLHEHDHQHEHDHDHNHDVSPAQEWLKSLLLLGMGLYFTYIIATGNLANYVNARFAWLSYVAAGLFLLLGISGVFSLLRGNTGEHEHHHDDDHVHPRLSWPIFGLLALPLILGVLIPSRPLSSAAAGGSISLSAVSTNNTQTAAFSSNPLEWNVLDWLRAFHNSGDPASFNGKQVDVIGFVYREPTFGKNQFMVARFAISCCVADASAIGLPVVWDKAGSFKQDTWVRVKGALQAGDFRGDSVPMLQAASVETVEQPAHPYLYP